MTRTTPYYVDFSAMSVREHSITIWTNLHTIMPVLTFMPSLCDYDVVYRDDEQLVLVVTIPDINNLPVLEQIIQDCITVENLLENVEVPTI